MPSKYPVKKARMERDPEYRTRLLRAQAESRRKRRSAEHEEAVSIGNACPIPMANGRHCWKGYAHKHGGELIDPMPVDKVNS